MFDLIQHRYFKPRLYIEGESFDQGIQLSSEPCILSSKKDKNSMRGIMSCGHTIDPTHLFSYCSSTLAQGKFVFNCPYVSPLNPQIRCKKIWTFKEIKVMALLSKEEKTFFEKVLNENLISSTKTITRCNKCKSIVIKNNESPKLTCLGCKLNKNVKNTVCFQCQSPWKKNSDECFEPECKNGEKLQLNDQRLIQVVDKEVPSIRSCKNCSTLIEFVGSTYCRTVVCPCGQKFCFICGHSEKVDKYVSCQMTKKGCVPSKSMNANW